MRPTVAALAGVALVAASALTGCASSGSGSGSPETRTVTVLAAASLTEAFTELGDRFEEAHPGTSVRLVFDSSATLAEQVTQGAPADVLATADEETMQTVVADDGTAGAPRRFASNHLLLVTPASDPAGVRRLADLSRPGVRFVVCVATAPCGKLAATVLAENRITAKPASEEVDVKAVLGRVRLDEADAGLVYASDAVAAGSAVRTVDVPESEDNLNHYPIAPLADAAEPALARDWVRLVLSAQGRSVLEDDGFGKP